MTEIDFSNGVVMPNFSNYVVFPEEGKIWSLKSNRFIGSQQSNGYWKVWLGGDDGSVWQTSIQRVIWMSVHGEIPEDMEINHKTEDKNMNGIQFLELVTHKDNINYGSRNQRVGEKLTNRQDLSKQVAAYNKDGVLAMAFSSTAEAQRAGFDSGHISQCCNGIRKSHKNYQWLYYVDSPPLFYIAA